MTFDWSEYLQLARELAGKTTTPSSQEAKLRSAISRAYYAAFVKARNFLSEHDGLTIPRENTHFYVINQLRNSIDERRRKLGQKLRILRDIRNQADYNNTFLKLNRATQNALNLSRQIISALSSL